MHIFRRLKNFSRYYISRNIRSNALRRNKKSLFIIFAGFSFLSYYFLFAAPKARKKNVIREYAELEDEGPLNKKKFDLKVNAMASNVKEESPKIQFNFIDKVVKKCAPGVFHIYITSSKPTASGEIVGTPFVYGSGFVIREDGLALTNAHVVLNKDSYISCRMTDGTVYGAEIVDMDVNMDVALLKLNTDKKLTALPLEEPGVVDVGEWVVALGSPLCLSNSISVGIVSSIDRSAKELGLKNYSMSYIQTDALITFGNSGGPLVNIDGKVIGISSLRLTSGISFAIPIEFCLKFLRNCKTFSPNSISQHTKDEDKMTLFGLTTIPVTCDLLLDLMQRKLVTFPKDIDEGLLVWKVLDGSLAQEYGLSAGDVITHINKVPVKYAADLYKIKTQTENIEFIVIKKETQEEFTFNIPLDKI